MSTKEKKSPSADLTVRGDAGEGIAEGYRFLFADVNGVIFDLDGTLIDSMSMWESIDREYLGRFGIPLPEGFQQELNGLSVHETAVYYRKRFPSIPQTEEEMIASWMAMAEGWYKESAAPKPGAVRLLEHLSLHAVPMAIATSNARVLLLHALDRMGIRRYFKALRTGDEKLPGKPAPDIYLAAAKDLGVSPEKCLVFEDIPGGLLAGKRAGMRTVAVYDGENEEAVRKKRELADAWLEDYHQLFVE